MDVTRSYRMIVSLNDGAVIFLTVLRSAERAGKVWVRKAGTNHRSATPFRLLLYVSISLLIEKFMQLLKTLP
jgi:hypothetical protein